MDDLADDPDTPDSQGEVQDPRGVEMPTTDPNSADLEHDKEPTPEKPRRSSRVRKQNPDYAKVNHTSQKKGSTTWGTSNWNKLWTLAAVAGAQFGPTAMSSFDDIMSSFDYILFLHYFCTR